MFLEKPSRDFKQNKNKHINNHKQKSPNWVNTSNIRWCGGSTVSVIQTLFCCSAILHMWLSVSTLGIASNPSHLMREMESMSLRFKQRHDLGVIHITSTHVPLATPNCKRMAKHTQQSFAQLLHQSLKGRVVMWNSSEIGLLNQFVICPISKLNW